MDALRFQKHQPLLVGHTGLLRDGWRKVALWLLKSPSGSIPAITQETLSLLEGVCLEPEVPKIASLPHGKCLSSASTAHKQGLPSLEHAPTTDELW